MNSENNRVASLIYFADNVEKERVLRWIEKLKQQGYVDSHTTKEYDPQYGDPILYFP